MEKKLKVKGGFSALVAAVALSAVCVLGLAGCQSSSSSSTDADTASTGEKQEIEVACLTRDTADVYWVAEQLADKYTITPKTIDDNNALNEAVNGGDVLISYWEDAGTMQKWNEANDGHLAAYGDPVSCAPLMLVAHGYTIDTIPQGAKCVISDNSSSQARALRMLDEAGIITLNDAETPTIYDLAENPHGLEFITGSARDGWSLFADADLLCCTGTTVLNADDPDVPVSSALCVENTQAALAGGGVVLVTTEETNAENPQWLQDIYEVMSSKDFADFIAENYGGAKLAAASE